MGDRRCGLRLGLQLPDRLGKQDLGYVVAVRTDFAVWAGFRQVRAKALLAEVPADAWHRLNCGDGSKGPRLYDWALLRTNSPEPKDYARWLLIRRSIVDPNEVAYFACGGPPATTLEELVRIAGRRWTIEEDFELAKGDCGLDEYEVRSWDGWYRHVTLSLWALAVVTVIRSRSAAEPAAKKGGANLIRLSVPEVRKLLVQIVWHRIVDVKQTLEWSRWRRRHQYLGQIPPLPTPPHHAERRSTAVGLGYATRHGSTLIERELYLAEGVGRRCGGRRLACPRRQRSRPRLLWRSG